MKRKTGGLTALLLALILIVTPLLNINAMGAAVYTRPQKHLYLVLDDSGSMKENGQERDLDANYALQTLIAMTDKTDTINVYFLNNGNNVYGKIDLAQKSDTMLNNIMTKYPPSDNGTSYDVVKTAQEDLKKAVAADDTGEYWLIVLTDGDFNYPEMNYKQDLKTFAQSALINGDLPNVMCIGINSAAVIPLSEATAPNVHALEGSNVFASMNEAASIISGRIEIKDCKASSGNKKLSFNIPYPAKNIVVLAQNIQTSIVSSSASSNLNTTEKYTTARPDRSGGATKSNVFFITESKGGSIAPGEVSLTFDTALDINNTVVVVEPAIGLVAHFYNQDGDECDPAQLKVKEKAKLVYELCDPTTQQKIDESIIQGGVKYSADINGDHYDSNSIEFTVGADELKLDMYAEFTDGFTLDIHDVYKGLTEFRVIALNPSTATFTADINDLKDTDVITATPTHNSSNFLNEEFNACKVEVKGTGNPFKLRVDVKGDPATGTYTIAPKGGFLKVFTPVQQEIEVVFTSDRGEVVSEKISIELTGTRNWIGFVLAILAILFLIYCLIVYIFFKPRFPLDLRLNCYVDRGDEIDIKHPEDSKSIFYPGVLDFWSVLPIPGPFKINASAFDMDGIVIEAINDSKRGSCRAQVNGIKESEVAGGGVYSKYAGKFGTRKKFDFEIYDIEHQYPAQDGLSEENNGVFYIKDGEYITEQEHHAVNSPPKRLRYVRNSTLKTRREK